MRVEYTKTKTLPKDATRRHVFLCFYLCEVEGAGKNEDVHQVDEALQEGDGGFHCQTLRGFDVLQFMLVDENKENNKDVRVDLIICCHFNMRSVQKGLQAADGTKTPTEGVMTLTVEEVAAESRGKMPPQAMMRLSTT